ncbi:putative metal-binding motif-containing protein [Corallococcus sp. EGB]|uniref:putative metal-binding motif-containing protein n=1 Tax=Corallococcus sp. EGB TaxID=1521117 RepID=UPI001CBBF1C1|nr:putative metal-binding motif-containing protein [Corallococcus sp. EGB]
MKRAWVVGFGLLSITCTVPDIEELEAERPSGCDASHPCDVEVRLTYDGFHPGCVTLRVVDAEDASRTFELPVPKGAGEVGFIRRAGWSEAVKVTASARERSCTGQEVATASAQVKLLDEDTASVGLTLSALDEDGDGYVSTATRGTDCDDHSVSISPGVEERCDFLDNNCDGRADPVPVCDGVDWRTTGTVPRARFQAVAPHARGQAWMVGDSNDVIAHVRHEADGGFDTQVFTDCHGAWSAAWARPGDGRVFMGSWEGQLATRTLATWEPCTVTSFDGGGAAILDIVGFDVDGGTTLYAVSEAGDILRWDHPAEPRRVEHVDADLRSIHGLDPTTLIAVGTTGDQPVAYRFNADGGPWLRETLPQASQGQVALQTVHVVSPGLAYAAGDRGLFLERARGTWRTKPSYPIFEDGGVAPGVLDVVAFGQGIVFARLESDDIVRFDGAAWQDFRFGTQGFTSLDALTSDELWSAAIDGTGFYWGPWAP